MDEQTAYPAFFPPDVRTVASDRPGRVSADGAGRPVRAVAVTELPVLSKVAGLQALLALVPDSGNPARTGAAVVLLVPSAAVRADRTAVVVDREASAAVDDAPAGASPARFAALFSVVRAVVPLSEAAEWAVLPDRSSSGAE